MYDIRKEKAILEFKRVCIDCEDDYFDLLDSNTIEIARDYALIGMECEESFKYAVDYGRMGLEVIKSLQLSPQIPVILRPKN